MAEQMEQICPSCGCVVGTTAYKKEEVTYCCEPCAIYDECECGCCEEEEE